MTDKELQQLAREVAQSIATEVGIPMAFVQEMQEIKFIPKVLKALLRTHCIVGKKKVKALCRLTIENSISVDYALIDGLTDLVCDMFSDEYHKEMDNE